MDKFVKYFVIVLMMLVIPTYQFFFSMTQKCTNVLPYGTININQNEYSSWYGKLGQNLNGTKYESGHAFERHIAVGGKCTAEQKSQNKTVFKQISEFYKTLSLDATDCTMTSQKAFNFLQHHQIASASNYIHGIDCKTGEEKVFMKYFIEFKRAVKNSHPSQTQYMVSQKATLWTLYPQP